MSNSAFTNFLASLRAPSDTPRAPLGGEPNARLIGVPLNVRDEVIAERRPVRVQGEVVQTKPDGTVRVRTERGDIEFRPAEGQRPPAEGQKIEIEIPPNVNAKKSPDVVIYRRLPDQTPQSSNPRTTGTPVEVRVDGQSPPVRVQAPQQPVSTQPQSFPPEGTAIRLQPLPPQIQNALTPYVPLEQFTVTLAPVSDVKLQTIVQNAQSDLSAALATLKVPSALATTSPLTPPSPPLDFLGGEGYERLAQSAYPKLGEGGLSSPAIPTTSKTILQNFTENLPKLPAQILQKIAFGSLEPALQTTAGAAQTPAPLAQKLQTLDVTLTGKTSPILEFKTQNFQTTLVPPKAENIILSNQKAGTITGIVTNFTPAHLPVVDVFFPQTGATQSFTLQFPTSQISVGSTLIFTPQTPTALQSSVQNLAQVSQAQLLPLPLQLAPGAWPVIDEIYQALTQTHPPIAQAMATVTPSPTNPAQMSPAMLFFVAAVRGGDLTQWLSDKTIDALKSTGKSSLLSRLTQEGSNLSRLTSETLSQDWRALNLPMLYHGDMQKIALYYRNEYNKSANEENGKTLKGTRFVFDLNLDAMGKVQLDGLFRPVSDAGKRLDLVVRTEQFFSQATQGEMRRVYARALRDTGVTGELSFQNKPESWVSIQAQQNSLFSANT